MKFLRSDLFRSFGLGFVATAAVLAVTKFDATPGVILGLF